MGLFSSKEDTKHIKDFDAALADVNALAVKFRAVHFSSLGFFGKNFEGEKTEKDLQKERALFETHLDILQSLRHETDRLIDEAFRIVRNETILTESDRAEMRKLLRPKTSAVTDIKVRPKKRK